MGTVPPVLTLKCTTQCLPICLHHAQSHHPSTGVQGECLHGPFNSISGFPCRFPSHPNGWNPPLVLTAKSFGGSSSWHEYSGQGNLVWGAGIACFFVGNLCGEGVSPSFQPPHVGVGPAYFPSLPLLLLTESMFFSVRSPGS